MFSTLREALDHNEQTQNPRLDLGKLGLTGNEPELQRLKNFTWLDTLIFSNEWYEWNKEKQTEEYYESQNKGKPNKLTSLPAYPPQLKRFICAGELFGNRFKISNIAILKELNNLTYLDISSNQIVDITPLQELNNLTQLDLSDNQIVDITPLKELNNLIWLTVSRNQIVDITPLKELKSLMRLLLHNNQIADITPLHEIKNLIGLYLNKNQIVDIMPLKELKNLTQLYFFGNPFYEKLPAHLQDKDGLEILQYWIALRKSDKIREAKVVFVGEGNAGKTSLMHLLLYGRRAETTRTERIEIHTHDTLFSYGAGKEALKLHFWDFGGQEIMHATHKFFMSSRTLYVLIVDGRKNDHEALYNWVAMLQSSMGDSPVLVVANHLDEPKDTHRLPEAELKQALPHNLHLPVIETSWKTGRGLDKLQEAIQATLQTMPHFEENFPEVYQNIKAQLESRQDDYIDYKTYQGVCQAVERDFDASNQTLLADILNDLGIMLNFRNKKETQLEDMFIFKPAWIVDGVYQIINAAESQQQKGKISQNTAFELLKGIGYSTPAERSFIIDMMKHFRLAYEQTLVGKCHYLMPSLFPPSRPEAVEKAWQETNTLRVRFEYDVWRHDYISYFLVSQHQHIEGAHYWVNGAILRYDSLRVHIEANRPNKAIEIEVAGEQDKRYAFWRVREALAEVHAMFDEAKLGINMFVVYQEAGKEQAFNYEELKIALSCGESTVFSAVFRKRLSINALLGEVSLAKAEIPEVIKTALACIERADYAGYFREIGKLDLPTDQKEQYFRHKREFEYDKTDFQFSGRLRVFAQGLLEG